MNHCQICYRCSMSSLVLDMAAVDIQYCYSVSYNHSVQWQIRSHESHCECFSWEQDSMKQTIILHREICPPEAVAILYYTYSNVTYASYFSTDSWFLSESCDYVGSATKWLRLILMTRLRKIRNTRICLWSMWRMNTVWKINVCMSLHRFRMSSNILFSSAIASTSHRASYDS